MNKAQLDKMIKELTQDAQEFLMEEFGINLAIPILANGRIKRTLGRFRYRQYNANNRMALDIELAKIVLATGYEESWDVLKHELIHYALFELGLPHSDNDYEFINACKTRNVLLSGDDIEIRSRVAIYKCSNCDKHWFRAKHYKNKVYSHKQCGGQLEYQRHDFSDTIDPADMI